MYKSFIIQMEKQITTSCKDLKDVFVSDDESYEITTKDGEDGIFIRKKIFWRQFHTIHANILQSKGRRS